jgi:hypothetical protein
MLIVVVVPPVVLALEVDVVVSGYVLPRVDVTLIFAAVVSVAVTVV